MRRADLETPALLLDAAKIAWTNVAARRDDVTLRPHPETGRSVEVAGAMTKEWPGAVMVSALKEAAQFFVADYRDILYIMARRDGGSVDVARFPVGTLPRVLPNHVCASAARHGAHQLTNGDFDAVERSRFGGW